MFESRWSCGATIEWPGARCEFVAVWQVGKEKIMVERRSRQSEDSQTPIGLGSIEIAPGAVLPSRAVQFSATRSGGPGGQNVNKVNTRIQMRIAFDDVVTAAGLSNAAQTRLAALVERYLNSDDEIVIASGRCRSQARNRETCLARLRELIVQARVAPKKRRKTRPSRGAVEKRLKGKRERADAKKRRGWTQDRD